MKERILLPNLGILTALASSLCCIMPVLAIVAGTSGLASTFSWLEPARPYFIGASVLVLGFAWYQKLKPQPIIDACGCSVEQKTPFMQTKAFLGIITLVSALLLSFPSYAHVFFPKSTPPSVISSAITQKVEFKIEGMTCSGCEEHVSSEINKLKGIAEVVVSYEKGTAIVAFDGKQTTVEDIIKAINATGYNAVNHKSIS
jgi:mercuric ion transport protein